MEIRLKQQDVELAVKAHLQRMGFDRPVAQMTFTAGRGDRGLTVEIEVTDPFNDEQPDIPPGPIKRDAAKDREPVKDAAPKAKAKTKSKPAPEPEAVPEPEAEMPLAEDDVQPDDDYDDGGAPVDDEPPFATTAEAANEPVTATKSNNKSLFG